MIRFRKVFNWPPCRLIPPKHQAPSTKHQVRGSCRLGLRAFLQLSPSNSCARSPRFYCYELYINDKHQHQKDVRNKKKLWFAQTPVLSLCLLSCDENVESCSARSPIQILGGLLLRRTYHGTYVHWSSLYSARTCKKRRRWICQSYHIVYHHHLPASTLNAIFHI